MKVETEVVEHRERRNFLKALIGLSAATITAITVIPCVGYILAPALSGGRRRKRKVIFGNPSELGSSTYVAARYEGQEETAPGLFVRFEKGEPVVLSAECTHASCSVKWSPADNKFLCPCHQGQFDATGKNIAGPPPLPLVKLTATKSGNDLYILEPEA
jgi:Rieske Fe-S protein